MVTLDVINLEFLTSGHEVVEGVVVNARHNVLVEFLRVYADKDDG